MWNLHNMAVLLLGCFSVFVWLLWRSSETELRQCVQHICLLRQMLREARAESARLRGAYCEDRLDTRDLRRVDEEARG